MLSRKIFLLLAASCVMSGCGISANNYSSSQEILRGSASVRNEFVQGCIIRITKKPLHTRQAIAKVMSVAVRSAPSIYCRRITRGITSGRLKHADVNAGARGQLTPTVVRVLQGR
jgi:predicted component of type VI protein secretion system